MLATDAVEMPQSTSAMPHSPARAAVMEGSSQLATEDDEHQPPAIAPQHSLTPMAHYQYELTAPLAGEQPADPVVTAQDAKIDIMSKRLEDMDKKIDALTKQNTMLFELVSSMCANQPSRSHTIKKNGDIVLPRLPMSTAEEVNRMDHLLLDATFNEQMVISHRFDFLHDTCLCLLFSSLKGSRVKGSRSTSTINGDQSASSNGGVTQC